MELAAASQPVLDLELRAVCSYQALVRGRGGQGAAEVFARRPEAGRYAFGQVCRITALSVTARLGLSAGQSVNFLPNALSEADACLRTTVRAARHYGFLVERLTLELTEDERVADLPRVRECQAQGLRVTIDDFGAGYAGLNLLADLAPTR